MILALKYYTTYENIKTLRKVNYPDKYQEDDEDDNEINNNENQISKIKDEIGDFLSIDIEKEEDFQKNEYSFLLNINERFKRYNNNIFELKLSSNENDKDIKLTLIRYIFVNNSKEDVLFKEKPEKEINEQNYFIPQYQNIGSSDGENFGEIFNTYRRNCNDKFFNDIEIEASIIEKNKISFPTETYFNDN